MKDMKRISALLLAVILLSGCVGDTVVEPQVTQSTTTLASFPADGGDSIDGIFDDPGGIRPPPMPS
ncbi:MAG: hypothetical protein GF414_03460 [Candidatus Altiarchaeales archaeon]|nr:hypothetical protein [Candidatus Altiarchaeales archaeon]